MNEKMEKHPRLDDTPDLYEAPMNKKAIICYITRASDVHKDKEKAKSSGSVYPIAAPPKPQVAATTPSAKAVDSIAGMSPLSEDFSEDPDTVEAEPAPTASATIRYIKPKTRPITVKNPAWIGWKNLVPKSYKPPISKAAMLSISKAARKAKAAQIQCAQPTTPCDKCSYFPCQC